VTGQAINHVGQIYFADLDLGNIFTALPKRKASSNKRNIGLLLAVGGVKVFLAQFVCRQKRHCAVALH
jgi:hypothetical protein